MSDSSTPGSTSTSAAPEVARLIRSPQGTGQAIKALFEEPARRLVKREVLSHVQHAQDALGEAQAQAQEIIEQAHLQAQEIREQARKEGAHEGHTEATKLLGYARAEYERLLQAQEQDMLDLSFGIAQRIIAREIALNPDVVKGIVLNALDQVRNKRQIVLIVHPEDALMLEQDRALLGSRVEGAKLYIEEDDRVERGGCVIETESGRVDARLDVQLGALRDALGGDQ